jgi:NitT/TauT family transport system ATP-binding protein
LNEAFVMEEKEPSGLPNAKVGQIIELVQKLSVLGGSTDKHGLAYALGIKANSLSNPLKASELLGFVTIDGDNITLTEVGKNFEESNEDDRKEVFGKQLSKVEPFSTVIRALQKEQEIDDTSLLRLVKAKISSARKWKESTNKEMLRMILNWGEFGKLFSYDNKTKKVRYLGT